MGIKTWCDEDEQELIELYTSGKETDVYKLAEYYGKGHRSVISKLVQLKIYIAPKDSKVKKPTVKEMIIELEDILDIKIDSLNLSKKDTLYTIVQAIKSKLEIPEDESNET